MSRVEKILKKWTNRPTEVPRDEVVKILDFYDIKWEFKIGSHIVAQHDALIGQKKFGFNGEFTIPTVKGRSVKGWYIKEILVAIEIIKLENKNG